MNWDDLRERTTCLHLAREEVLVQCRKLTQLSSKSIRHVHRHEYQEAEQFLNQAKKLASDIRQVMSGFPEMNPSYLHDSEKEMVEAAAVLAITQQLPIPTAAELGASTMAYLHGCCEAASEVRRFVLDQIRTGNISESERILATMNDIYEELITFDFPDSLTNGLRRSVDALRAVLERTRSDLTLTTVQITLVQELRKKEND